MATDPVSISGLTAADALDGDEILPVTQDGTTKKTTTADVAGLVDLSGITSSISSLNSTKAPLASPTFTGDVVVPDADGATEAMNRQTSDARYVALAGSTSTAEQVAPSFKASGKTGATATAVTLAGATTTGAPLTGAHVAGEVVFSDDGTAWRCTASGTPGTWTGLIPHGGRAAYLGPVATRGRIPSGTTIASTIYKQMMVWSRHVATDNISALRLLYSSIIGIGEVSTSGGPGTVKASVEYPVGTITQITFDTGAASGTIPANDHYVSDLVKLTTAIPAGAAFWVGTYTQWNGTNTPRMYESLVPTLTSAATRESVNASATSVTDTTLTGTRTNGGSNVGDTYMPTAILGMTTRPTFFLAGDSRTRADTSWDLISDQFGFVGLTEQVLGGRFGYINAGTRQDSYTNVISGTGNNYVKRLALSNYCSHVIDDYGINSVWTDSSATHQANVATFRAKFPSTKPYYKTTLIPQVTSGSTQIATDASDQTAYGTLSNFTTNNDWVRAGATGLIDGYIELEDLVAYKRGTSKFRPAERRVTDAAITSGASVLTSATAAFTSADLGKHVHVLGAGAAGAPLVAIIGTVTNATTVSLVSSGNRSAAAQTASTTVSGATAGIGVYASDNLHQTKQLEVAIRESNAWRPLSLAK